MTKPCGVFIQCIGALLLIAAASNMDWIPAIPGMILMIIGRKKGYQNECKDE